MNPPPFVRSWPARPLPFVVFVMGLAAWRRNADVNITADRSLALTQAIATRENLSAAPSEVIWLDPLPGQRAGGVSGSLRPNARALVRAHVEGEPSDLYLVAARLAPNGVLLDVGGVWNVTRTSGVDESEPRMHGRVAAYATRVDPIITAVHVLDLGGRDVGEYADFTSAQRWQTAITNLQNTGQEEGVVHASYALDPVAEQVDVAWGDNGLLDVRADGHAIVIDPKKGEAIRGAGWIRATPEAKARPGNLVTWAVDRVRSMPVFGDERMQWIKFVAFSALDRIERARTSVLGEADTEKDVQHDMEGLGGQAATYTEPEIGWPPARVPPILNPPLKGEGEWIVLDKDPFLANVPGAPPAFATTFVRADKERMETRVYMTMWDPRQIALHMEAGTVEPVSSTGEAGPGMIPRTPEVMRRLVAGFNGGFQALHGEYGMQVSGAMYLPPKPYAATVMELRDGTTAFGSWPSSPDVPPAVLSYRQNLTALIEKGRFNPWGRTWWGGTPKGWEDDIHTTRSGICLTTEGFVGYFWGNGISAPVLAASMIAARCNYAIHLDMNPGLAGFELYTAKPDAEWAQLGRPLAADWEYEGTFKALPGWHYRARKMVRGMMEQNFPQYIHLDARDFFYLTQRPILPGADLDKASPWRVKGLPQHGFPYAIARTALLQNGPQNLQITRIDPRVVRVAGSEGTTEQTPTVVTFVETLRPRAGQSGLWLGPSGFTVGDDPGNAVGITETQPLGDTTAAAVCVQDEDGMLAWIDLPEGAIPDGASAARMKATLEKMGCSHVYGVKSTKGGRSRLVEGNVPAASPGGVVEIDARLVRGEGPSSKLLFDGPIVGPNVWQPIQMQRIRYFSRPKKIEDAGAPDR